MNLSDVGAPVEGDLLYELRYVVLKCIFAERMDNPDAAGIDMGKFPGMQAVPICRRDFNFIRRSEYWVSEKSDGERTMLLANEKGTFVIDRFFNFFQVDSSRLYLPQLNALDKPHTKTLLDGEMVYNHSYNLPCFNVFDIVFVNGVRVADAPLSKRLAEIRENVVRPMRYRYPPEAEALLPFVIVGKEFWPLKKIKTIFDYIQQFEDKQGHRCIYENRKRFNENDGIIFTPEDRPYRPGTNYQLKKWKWPVFNTVDFLVKIRQPPQRFDNKPARETVAASDLVVEYRELHLRRDDHERLLLDLDGDTEAIAEFYYDSAQTGEWRYHRMRLDKIHPSPLSSVLTILESTADGLTKEEVLREVFANPPGPRHRRPGFEGRTPVQTPNVITPRVFSPAEPAYSPPVARSPAPNQSPGDEIYSTPSPHIGSKPQPPHPQPDFHHPAGSLKRSFDPSGAPEQDAAKRLRADSHD